MSEFAKIVGSKIRSLREDREHTREEFAHQAGISPTFLGDIERGKKEPSDMDGTYSGVIEGGKETATKFMLRRAHKWQEEQEGRPGRIG